MNKEVTLSEPQPQTYLRLSELAKILGWSRTNVYYWAVKCEIPVKVIAGLQVIPINNDLPVIIHKLSAAKKEAQVRRHGV